MALNNILGQAARHDNFYYRPRCAMTLLKNSLKEAMCYSLRLGEMGRLPKCSTYSTMPPKASLFNTRSPNPSIQKMPSSKGFIISW